MTNNNNNNKDTSKFKNKYRISSCRLSSWDYSWNGAYFITICTHSKRTFFGEISNDNMKLSESGKIVKQHWFEIPDRYKFTNLDSFVIMPNHIHGIIVIDKYDSRRDAINRVSTGKMDIGGITGINNPMLHDNISKVIRWFKGRTTFECRKLNPDFSWQSRFHDHIIRNEISYQTICLYIENNVKNWENDRFNF